jgi:toxin ParE1/3/4
MKLVFTDEARQDLIDIGDHIARDNPTRALTFVQKLRATASEILRTPQAFPILPRYVHLGLRRRVHGDYLIFYRSNGAEVSIVRILHGARDYEALLDTDD